MNQRLIRKIETILSENLPIKLGINKKNELVRLIFEVSSRDNISPEDILAKIGAKNLIEEGKGELFHKVKNNLLKIRYPSIKPKDKPHLVPVIIGPEREECAIWDFDISPSKIFVEKSVSKLEWTDKFLENFPGTEIREINDIKDGIKYLDIKDPIEKYNTRRENVFLVKNKSAFIKICPCTKGYKRCGYWILNVGFGCPIDCSYCYLQMYSNTPGIILPANIEDYYEHILKFDKKCEKRTRIGTGEFTDSLALDKYTGYSSYLIPVFRKVKNLVLELKTKTTDIDGILKEEAGENVVISWSVNTDRIAEKYEKGGASMSERLKAAEEVAKKGYGIGFHFDPVVFYPGWEDDYKNVVNGMFSNDIIRKNTLWVSLGTLRYVPNFKQTVEERFFDNKMFYDGEFFEDTDGKLRYPRELRAQIYDNMINWIREFDTKAWIYLCMEPKEVWGDAPFGDTPYI